MYSAAGFVGGASLCFYQQKIHGDSLLLALLESLFIDSKMPWDISIIAALQILTWILPSWEQIMKAKMLWFEGCYLLTYALKTSLLTITFMTLAFSSVLIELTLGIKYVNSLYLTVSSTTYICDLLFLRQANTFLQSEGMNPYLTSHSICLISFIQTRLLTPLGQSFAK